MVGASIISMPAGAISLKMQPLLYTDTLKKNERKNGYIDISNPTPEMLTLETSVQAFKQVDSKGNLAFYDDPAISAGLRPDLKEFSLKPGEAIHLAFQLDGTMLPNGDVFAALFVSAKEPSAEVPREVIRLGTLFTIVNNTPGERKAAITALHVPLITYGSALTAVYEVKNTAAVNVSSGFYPEVKTALQLFGGQQTIISPLVFAGNSRSVRFVYEGNRLGIYRLSVSTGSSVIKKWVIVVTGIWTWLLPCILFALAILLLVLRRHLRAHKHA